MPSELTFDFVIVGGGTAGAVVAARLSEKADTAVGLIEWGVDDRTVPEALEIKRWPEMLGGHHDLAYHSVDQPRGNSYIEHSRARILGGCSTHNTMIAFRPPDADFRDWVTRGASGWGPREVAPYFSRLATPIRPVAGHHRNPYLADVVTAASAALGVPRRDRWNDADILDGAGFLEIGYDAVTGVRSSTSVSYLHPIMDTRPNLEVLLRRRAVRLLFDDAKRCVGVATQCDDGSEQIIHARREVIVCCGAIDTPRLLLLSGIGPAQELRAVGVDVVHDAPGVGKELNDHPEATVLWRASREVPMVSATYWDVAVLFRSEAGLDRPDILAHAPLLRHSVHPTRLGYATPESPLSMTPNVTRPKSRGSVTLSSPDPFASPVIDFGYFTDADGQDERTLVAGIRMARRIAATEPMRSWIAEEVFPGPGITSFEELSAVARATHHTVYHPSSTARMGAAHDSGAVLDSTLRVRGVRGLRVADASAFPVLTTVNPVVAVLMLAERAADLVAGEWS